MTAPSVPGSLEKGVRLFQGEGVSGVVYERMSAFFTFAALTPTPLSLRELFQSQKERGSFAFFKGTRDGRCGHTLIFLFPKSLNPLSKAFLAFRGRIVYFKGKRLYADSIFIKRRLRRKPC